jgi:hypothetical protein
MLTHSHCSKIEQFNCTSPYAAPEGTICANIGGFIPTLSDKYYSEDESEPPTSLPKRTLTFYMSDLLSSQDEWLKRHGLENDGKYPYIRAVFVEQVGFRVVVCSILGIITYCKTLNLDLSQ